MYRQEFINLGNLLLLNQDSDIAYFKESFFFF